MKNLKKTLCLLLCLIMVVGLLPTMALAADSDTEISTVVATLAYTLNPALGAEVTTPRITVTTGNPAYFSSSMNVWQKKTGDTWENFYDSTFIAGTYRYSAQLRIDDSEGGEGYVLATEGLTVTVDGTPWTIGNVKDYGTYSLVAVFSPEFNVTADSAPTTCTFTTQPQGGVVGYDQSHIINWATDFDAVKQELVRYSSAGSVVQTQALSAGAFQASLSYMTSGYYYRIRVYYNNSSYIESDKIYVIPDQYFTPNPQYSNTEEDIIEGITYVPNGDGTFNANIHVDVSCVDGQMLQHEWGGTGYCWYDHENKPHYGSVGMNTNDFTFTLNNVGENLEPGKEWRVKVYLADDYYADWEWQGYAFSYVTDTVPELKPADKSGWQQIDGEWYFYENGVKVTGWLKDGTKWYYMDANGAMLTGWQKVDGKWYYLNNNMKTGWVSVGGKWYYLGTNGAMTTGWQKVSGKWYYMNANGVMQTGWQKISGKWYYLNSEMKTGWQKISGKWYYLNTEMKTGWQQLSGKWYYLGTDGAMRTGWVQLSGKWYYLNSSGVMVTGTQTIDGKTYKFNSNGVWIP